MSKFLYLALASRSLVSCVCSRDAAGVWPVLLLAVAAAPAGAEAAVGGANGVAATASVKTDVLVDGRGVVWEPSMTKLCRSDD